MAKAKERQVGEPEVTSSDGMALITQQIQKGEKLLKSGFTHDEYSSWELVTKNALESAFGLNSPNVDKVVSVGKYGGFPLEAEPGWWLNHWQESLRSQLNLMKGLTDVLLSKINLQMQAAAQALSNNNVASHRGGKRIFLVHGHDEGWSQTVSRFLEKLDQEMVILREQPNQGQTVIEKFEQHSDVGFAIVLMTPDDRGGVATSSLEQMHHRARQNVIFELGYFIAKLGRKRVTALYVEGVEIPSDYSGVLYLQLDARGAWRLELARELKEAGISVDMNKL